MDFFVHFAFLSAKLLSVRRLNVFGLKATNYFIILPPNSSFISPLTFCVNIYCKVSINIFRFYMNYEFYMNVLLLSGTQLMFLTHPCLHYYIYTRPINIFFVHNISMNNSLETYLHKMQGNILKPSILLTMRIVYNIACPALRASIYSKYNNCKCRIEELRHFFSPPGLNFNGTHAILFQQKVRLLYCATKTHSTASFDVIFFNVNKSIDFFE